jgi:hypothetical protein
MSYLTISESDLALYRRFDGDVDDFQRSGSPASPEVFEVWSLIEDLRQRLRAVATHQSSESFEAQLSIDLRNYVPDVHVQEQLLRLSVSASGSEQPAKNESL